MIFAGMIRLAAYSWLAKLTTALCNFGTIVLLSRLLGVTERGVCAWYAVLIAISLLITDIAAGGTVVYLMQQFGWRAMRKIYLFCAIGIGFAVTGAAFLLGSVQYAEAALLLVIAFFNAMFSFQNHVLLGLKQFRMFNISTSVAAFTLFAATYFFLQLGTGRQGYLYAMLLVWSMASLAQHTLLQRISPYVDEPQPNQWAVLKKMVGTGFINQLVQLLGLANNRFPFFWMKAGMLGVFSNSLALAEAMMLLPGSIGQVYYSQHAGQEPGLKDYRRFARLMVVNAGLIAVAVVVIQLLPESFYTLLFGKGFNGVGAYLKLLSFSMLFYSMYMMLSYWQSAHGKFYINLYCTIFSLLITCVFSLLFYVKHGWVLQNLVTAVAGGLVVSGVSAVVFFGAGWRAAAARSRQKLL
jgi:O-antigen/teichoic acid export membrane protein